MSRKALLVGINRYEGDTFDDLECCVDDARAMAETLARHDDGAPNFRCELLVSEEQPVTERALRLAIRELFANAREDDDLLFYFSGHGLVADAEGALVTQDALDGDPGYPMSELLRVANRAGAGSVLIILDCCHAGAMGDVYAAGEFNSITLSEGVTILSASTASQESRQGSQYSLFTGLVLDALRGGAANVRGLVTAAATYAYVEQALGPWQQRPLYKSFARTVNAVRRCKPAVSDEILRTLPGHFPLPDMDFQMDPSYERTDASAKPEHVAVFDTFKILRNAHLLTTEDGMDLYDVALQSRSAKLTPLGHLYWHLAKKGSL